MKIAFGLVEKGNRKGMYKWLEKMVSDFNLFLSYFSKASPLKSEFYKQ